MFKVCPKWWLTPTESLYKKSASCSSQVVPRKYPLKMLPADHLKNIPQATELPQIIPLLNFHCVKLSLWWTYKKLWKITMFNGKINYFDWGIFNSYVTNYRRLSHSIKSAKERSSTSPPTRVAPSPSVLAGPFHSIFWRARIMIPNPMGTKHHGHGVRIHLYKDLLLVCGWALPLWKIWVKVSWDDDIPNKKCPKPPTRLRSIKIY